MAESVNMEDFVQAIERIIAGHEKRNRLLNPKEREIVAFHEMGHAIIALALPGSDPVQKFLSKSIVDTIYTQTIDLLEKNREVVNYCAKELLKKETLDEHLLLEMTKNMHRLSAF